MTKILKSSNFQSFHLFFPEFLIDFVHWNVEKGQQGKGWVSFHEVVIVVVFYEDTIAMFRMKMCPIDTENDKIPQNFQFSKTLCNFLQILTDFVNWNV